MDLLKPGMETREPLWLDMLLPLIRVDDLKPARDQRRHLWPRWGLHAAGESLYVVLSKRTRTLRVSCLWVGSDVPHRRHGQPMHMTKLCHGQEIPPGPGIFTVGLSIDPVGSVGVAAHFEVVAELFVANGATL